MKITSRGRYGLRLLLDLALHQDQGPITLKDIAVRQKLPLPYLKHLTMPLVSMGILQSARGFKGGFVLAKAPEKIKLNEVIHVLEAPVAPAECVDDPEVCERSSFCATRGVWLGLQKTMEGVLEPATLRDMMDRREEKEQPVAAISSIEICCMERTINPHAGVPS
jgi:Rrf2 family transcriptional regulator, cysteine metabolism repressor